MEYYPDNQYDDGYHLNPHNRFLFIFCHASDVSESGWACFCCGRRVLNFKIAVFLFSGIMMFCSINDFIDLMPINYLNDKSDDFFIKMYYIKLLIDFFIFFSVLFSLYSYFELNIVFL